MSLLLTVYDASVWKTFVDASGLLPINEVASAVMPDAAIILPAQSLPTVSDLLSGLPPERVVWLAAVQAEYFLAEALNKGSTLAEAANAWEQQTNALLGLQRQQRKKLQLFNLHQALSHPAQFRILISVSINDYPAYTVPSTLSLLAACQYLAQRPDLQTLNTRLQASTLPLCDSEKLTLNVDQILLQSHSLSSAALERDLIMSQLNQVQEQFESNVATNSQLLVATSNERDQALMQLETVSEENQKIQAANAQLQGELKSTIEERDQTRLQLENASADNQQLQARNAQLQGELKTTIEERDLILAQLHQVQEQLEQYYLSLQTEQQNNKHALLARDKQQAKEMTKLEAELRKTKARAANAEYAGLLQQQELTKLRTSISWKAATPVRVLGRLIRKNEPEREKLLQDIGLLLTSEYFDVDWYLRAYPDVAENQINPAEHYLLHGAAEGRLPGPLFDGVWYLQRYPDVASVNMNPLLHFILYGQQEGRDSSPILLTNSSQEAEE